MLLVEAVMEVATPVTMVVVVVVSEECVDVDDMLVLDKIRNKVAELSGRDAQEGGSVSAMTINKGILLGFVPSNDSQEFIPHILKLHRVDEVQLPKHMSETNGLTEQIDLSTPQEECKWGNYARGAIYALQSRGNHLKTVSKISFAAG
ncbi:hypothetical protein BC332_18579 [Capsicum chinense]|nr:hypothetical protein BC332_18579 [Capsicum chinense]